MDIKNKRVLTIVLDSVGIGEMPDAESFGDIGTDTLGNIFRISDNLDVSNMLSLGLGNINETNIPFMCKEPQGAFGKAAEKAPAKDTTAGHWELMGYVIDKPFPTYPNGFPAEVVEQLEEKLETKFLGNCVASGTEIIKRLNDEHIKTGYPILYTSADSVLQIAANEDVISLDKLYEMCIKAREIMVGEHAVGRVIARPYIVKDNGEFVRTKRHDYSVSPQETLLDFLSGNNIKTIGVGKIYDIFAGRGINESYPTVDNADGIDKTIDLLRNTQDSAFIFTNLVDFDSKYGHRNDVEGYAEALTYFDKRLPEIINELKDEDLLIITADHGCDPAYTQSTDHSREYVPILAYGKNIKKNINLGIRSSFADVAATIADYFKVDAKIQGKSFLKEII